MTPSTPSASIAGSAAREKRSAALGSLGAAALLTALKIFAGMLTGSLGILSEAAHSGLDFVAAAVTYVSVRVADMPADRSHPFGHGKVENLSAFIQTALLAATSAWITFEAIRRLFFQDVDVEPSIWAFAVLFISVTVNTVRSRALFRAARQYDSQALEADALHFSTDVYSTGVVILGLVLIYVARESHLAWLRHADPIAALVVAAASLYVGMRLGTRTVDALLDAAPEGVAERIAWAVSRVPGVLSRDRIRVRKGGNKLFVDLRLTLESNISLEHAKSVVDAVESGIHELYPTADVVVDTAPQVPPSSDVVERIRSIAHRDNFEVHDVTAYRIDGHVNVNLDLEVDPSLSLAAAHDRATRLERAIQHELPEVRDVNVHLEPRVTRVPSATEAAPAKADMERKLLHIVRTTPGVLDCHELEAHTVEHTVVVTVHCRLQPGLPITRVHDVTEQLELRFREEFPHIGKVNIHAEPL